MLKSGVLWSSNLKRQKHAKNDFRNTLELLYAKKELEKTPNTRRMTRFSKWQNGRSAKTIVR